MNHHCPLFALRYARRSWMFGWALMSQSWLACWCMLACSVVCADDDQEFFEKNIRPVLVEHCYPCHSSESKELMGQLRLDAKAGWEQGGESGQPAIVPGQPEASPLLQAIMHSADASPMPPNKPRLSDQVVTHFTQWIRRGAYDPRTASLPANSAIPWEAEFRKRLDWWSLKPVTNVTVPSTGSDWPRDPVDQLVLRELTLHQLEPAPDADALTLLRRLSFVLTGLPPDQADVRTFPARFAHDAEAALDAIVNQYLMSPHFGERFARHWMDVVRYTDTYGYEWDNPAKGSWQYRDYLIRAFNKDIGFDQLIREQLAGDLLTTPRVDPISGFHESLIGPMFYHMGEHRHGDNEVINGVREEMLDNKVDAFSKAFLAMTVACARCHDHKLDAISQKDYYALAGMFMTPRWTSRSIEAPDKNAKALAELRQLRTAIGLRIQELWLQPAEGLAAGETLIQAIVQLDLAKMAKAKVGEVDWLIFNLLPERLRSATGADAQSSLAALDAITSDEALAAWQQAANLWRTLSEQHRQANQKFTWLADFTQPDWPKGFVIEGEGLQSGYASGGQPLIALTGDRAIEQLLPPGYHTHALSSKLPGALRLPHQAVLPGTFVSVALAGDEWSGFLRVSDNSFQTENVTFLSRSQPAWQALGDIVLANGLQRVAYEIVTCDLNPNFPPRTGIARAGSVTLPPQDDGFDKRSWFSLTGIVSHTEAGQPMDELRRFESLFAKPAPANARQVWKNAGSWLASSVDRYRHGPISSEDSELINWMLSRGLLPNRLADDAELSKLVQRYREVEAALPVARSCNSMDEREVVPVDYALNVRGDINRRSDPVPRGLPKFASQVPTGLCDNGVTQSQGITHSQGSGRLELAQFLTDPQHGLAARVYVNRVWQWIFGEALVRTTNDFGHLGELPSHPELLDYLAREFMADEWSTKRLIRRLVLSRTFRQSGQVSTRAATVDPSNRWLHHYPTRRLEAEAIRDALLAVSGRLDPELYGRPINPQRTVEDAAKRLFSGPMDGQGRRSIYLEVSIMDRSKFLQTFNAPDPKLPTGRRDETSGPAQALAMLNDPMVVAMADQWSARLLSDRSSSIEARLHSMFVQALGRPPDAEEVSRWAGWLQSLSTSDHLLNDSQAWTHAAHTMFNLQEFTHYR